jgi:hypothetical protein
MRTINYNTYPRGHFNVLETKCDIFPKEFVGGDSVYRVVIWLKLIKI